jgi:ADP-ribose pyrophosphatase YjhB (NUDIX family)
MAISPYLRELRAKVGNELLLLPAVAIFVVIESTRQVLLCRNAGQTHWEAIGGMVEPNEHPRTAAQRELFEEAGLSVEAKDLVLLGSVGGPEYLVTYPNGHQVSYATSVYRVSLPLAGPQEPAKEAGLLEAERPMAEPVADGVEVLAVGWHHIINDVARPDPSLYGLFLRSLLAEFHHLL